MKNLSMLGAMATLAAMGSGSGPSVPTYAFRRHTEELPPTPETRQRRARASRSYLDGVSRPMTQAEIDAHNAAVAKRKGKP